MSSTTRQTVPARQTNRSGEQALRPRARFLRTFGDELISSETVALIELVKNSYDADATRILVRFTPPFEVGQGAIEVIDNGHGMSLQTIQSAWMEPATLMKRRNTRSEKLGRRVLGEKGIGRFAASRLAKQLRVITKREKASSQTKVFFDWEQFDDPELFLDQIMVSWYEEPPGYFARLGTIRALWEAEEAPTDRELSHGTILRMENLSVAWDEIAFQRLRDGLSRLVSPFIGQNGKNGRGTPEELRISLEVPEPFDEFSGPIGPPETLRSAQYTLEGSIDESGGYNVSIRLKGQEDAEIVAGDSPPGNSRTPYGPFEIQLHVWDRDTESIQEIARSRDVRMSTVRDELNAVAGISVYRDGFRVFPYGEAGNDWLSLDSRRVQSPPLRLSNNQIVGYVLIGSDRNPSLRDQSNREGLIEGTAFTEFKVKVREILSLLESRRFNLRASQRQRKQRRGGLFVDFDLADVVELISKTYPDNRELVALTREKAQDLDRRIEEAQEVISRYHRLATLGNLIDIVLHDGRAPLSKISQAAFMAQRDVSNTQQLSLSAIERLRKHLNTVRNQSTVLGTLLRRIEPFGGRRRGRPAEIAIEEVIKDACSVLSSESLRLGAKLDLPSSSTTVTVEPSEIQEVFVNLLSNSLHWLQYIDKENRKVRVEVERKSPIEVRVLFSDSGPGVEDYFSERIFDPYFSTKPNGVGLGLAIAGGIIDENYNGELELLNSGPLPGATFQITLRKRV